MGYSRLGLIEVVFDPSDQEPDIRKFYGETGDNLEGPLIYKDENSDDEIISIAKVSASFQSSENDFVTVKTELPEWGDIPEDQGDHEAWMEADREK